MGDQYTFVYGGLVHKCVKCNQYFLWIYTPFWELRPVGRFSQNVLNIEINCNQIFHSDRDAQVLIVRGLHLATDAFSATVHVSDHVICG